MSHCDCYDNPVFEKEQDGQTIWHCRCGEEAGWHQLIDTTNGSFCPEWDKEKGNCIDSVPEDYDDFGGLFPYHQCNSKQKEECKKSGGRIDGFFDLEIDKEAVYHKCEHCGCTKTISEETYKIPKDAGHVHN